MVLLNTLYNYICLFIIIKILNNNNMKSIIGDLTSETINFIYKECEKEQNKKRLNVIINNITNIAFQSIKPYLYTIMAILILLFLMNCFQFYYYAKSMVTFQKSNIKMGSRHQDAFQSYVVSNND
jgi:hypothetical protein